MESWQSELKQKPTTPSHSLTAGAPAGSSYNLTQGTQDIITLSEVDFTTAFPSHDHATGVPKAAVVDFAQGLQKTA